MKITKNLLFEKILFFISIFFTLMHINLFYPSVFSPDFIRYKSYIEFFFNNSNTINSEQGVLYFFIISFFILFQFSTNNIDIPSNLDQIGNQINFNLSSISEIEYQVGLGIQYGNFLIFIFGILGIYKLLKVQLYGDQEIYLVLTFLMFLPINLQMLLTFKPEILGLTLSIWSIYFIEKFRQNKSFVNLMIFAAIFSILLTTKASIAGMMIIFFLLLFNKYKILKLISFKKTIILFSFFLFLIILIYVENVQLLNRSFFERAELNQIYNQLDYDNKATPDVFFRINFSDLIFNPKKDFHADSLVGITLLDSFGDYFNEYWNKDYTFYNKFRKEFIIYNQDNLYINFPERVISQNILNFHIDNLRKLFSLLQSIFYILGIAYLIIKDKSDKKLYILSPIIGILILMINSLGFPENNFNPDTGDLFKSFYYSFFLCLSFIYVLIEVLKNIKLKNKLILLVFYICINLFIFGFPKANNSELDITLINLNSVSTTCELNKIYLKTTLIEYRKVDCENQDVIKNLKNLKNLKVPRINLIILLSVLVITTSLFLKNKIMNLLNLNKHLINKISKFVVR